MVSSPSVPAPPDPVATANAQGAVNRETAISNATMSHVNQTSPYGSQQWSYDTSTPGGRAWSDYTQAYSNWQANTDPNRGAAPEMPDRGIDPQWRLSTSFSPAQQSMFDATNRIGNNALNIGEQQLGRVGESLSSPLSTDGLPARQMSAGASPGVQTQLGVDWNNLSAPEIERYFGSQPDIQAARAENPNFDLAAWYQNSGRNEVLSGQRQGTRVGTGDPAQGVVRDIGATSGGIQYGVDPTSGQIRYDPGYSGVDGLMGQAGNIQRSLDLSGLAALPGADDFSADRQRVEDALYGRTTSRLDPQWQQQQNDLAVRLANQGVTTGSEAWQREMDAFNRARNDAYSGARNDAILAGGTEQSRLFGNALAARQQGWTETLGSGNFANAAQAQAFGELTTDRNRYTSEMDRLLQANNTAQQQQYAQNLSNAQFNNAAQTQDFGQQAARAAFTNAAQAQGYGQALNSAQFGNQAQQQIFGQNLAGAQFGNAARDAAMNERSTLRMAPLNELRGLMGMGAVQAPQFGQVSAPQMAAPDLMGATYNSYNGQMNSANAAAANNTSMFNGVLGAAGTAGAIFL